MRIQFLAKKRWRFPVGPCGEGFARSNEGALSSTGSAWVCCIVYTNNVPFQAHHAKKHMKITQRCDESSCQILKMVFNRMDIDSDSDNDIYNDNTPCLWWFASLGKQSQKWQPPTEKKNAKKLFPLFGFVQSIDRDSSGQLVGNLAPMKSSIKVHWRVPVNRPLLWILKSTIKVYWSDLFGTACGKPRPDEFHDKGPSKSPGQ